MYKNCIEQVLIAAIFILGSVALLNHFDDPNFQAKFYLEIVTLLSTLVSRKKKRGAGAPLINCRGKTTCLNGC